MNSYQMVLHRPVETARLSGKFAPDSSANPFFVHFEAEFGSSFGRIVSDLPTTQGFRHGAIAA